MVSRGANAPLPLRTRSFVLLLLGLLLGLLAPLLVAGSAQAATGRVRGVVDGPGNATPRVKVSWFTEDWTFLGSRRADGGGYSLVLAPGTYHLQFADQRPPYDVDKDYPADLTVTVTAGATTVANVKMHRGAAIGGTVVTGGKVAAGARIVAANKQGNSFETTANSGGEFALGGLPPGSYSVFTYDQHEAYVGKSSFLPRLKGGVFRTTNIDLTTRAGRFVIDLYAGDQPYPGIAYVTAVSRKNGQFWTAKAAHGTVTLGGLYPGKYDLVVPGIGNYLGGTLAVSGKVKSGRTGFGSIRLTQLGATITGTVVDSQSPSPALADALVTVYDGAGDQLAQATTGTDGSFELGGPLTTRSDLSVVVGPGGANPPYLHGVHYCMFGTTTRPGVAIVTGMATSLGPIPLPHSPNTGGEDPSC